MKNSNLLIVIFFSIISINTTLQAEIVPIPDTNYDVQNDFKINLSTFIGKRVQLILTNGHEVSGTIKNVGEKMVHLESLSGKDFFDALIRLDDISVVEAQFRQIQHIKPATPTVDKKETSVSKKTAKIKAAL